MDIVRLVFIVMSALILIVLIRRINTDYAMFISTFINIGIIIFSLGILVPVFEYIRELCKGSGQENLAEVLIKSAGVQLLCSVGAEMCVSLGESTLKNTVEFAGKCTLLAFSLPLIKKVFDYASAFLL